MEQVKRIVIQVLIILIVASVVTVEVLSLENTSWADSLRLSAEGEVEQENSERERMANLPSIIGLIKPVLFMTVAGLLTYGLRWIGQGFKRAGNKNKIKRGEKGALA